MEKHTFLAKLLEDINTDFLTKRTDILEHAAEISPEILERTIGSDLASTTELPNKHEEKQHEMYKSKNDTTINDKKSNLVIETLNVSSLKILDLQTVAEVVRRKEAERRRLQHVRKDLIHLQEEQRNNFLNLHKNIDLLASNMCEFHDKWLAKKLNANKIIKTSAKENADLELRNFSLEIDSIMRQSHAKLQTIYFQGLLQYQRKFRMRYEFIVKLIMSNEARIAFRGETEHNEKLKQLVIMFEQLINKIKVGECGLTELLMGEKLSKGIEALEIIIANDLKRVIEQATQKQQELQNQKIQQELQMQAELQQQQQQQQIQQQQQQDDEVDVTTVSAVTTTVNNNNNNNNKIFIEEVRADRLQFYTHINAFYQEKLEKVKVLQADDAFKKFRSACQKSVNMPINAISAVSREHLRDKFEKLYGLISGQIIKTIDCQFSINEHPLGRDYCILLMAKKFVNQGDTAISSNPQAAFPVASIVVSLWKSVPDFGKIFLAYVFKEAPFLVPYFILKKDEQSIEDYYKTLGYRISDGKVEPHDMFLKRLAGIGRLYAAIMVTGSAAQLDVAPHPYGIEQAWRLLTNFISLEPLPDICATLLLEILQIVGSDLYQHYGKQFVKLLLYIQQQYFPRLATVDEGGPKARLELLLNKFLREGIISKPQGMLTPGFW